MKNEYKGDRKKEGSSKMISDKYLIRKIIKKGSSAAADELVRRYYDELYLFLYRQIGNKEDSLDMTQDVFIAALDNLMTYNARRASFKTWLFRIGTYKVIDSRRKKQLLYEELDDNQWLEEVEIDEKLLEKEMLENVNRYVATFRPEIQEVFRLRVYGGLSFKEISELLLEKEEKVKAQYYRLITKIRKEFRDEA